MTEMNEKEQLLEEVSQASPDDLMKSFVRSPILLAIVLGILIHVVVIGATSVNYILEYEGVIEPELKTPAAATQPADTENTAAEGEAEGTTAEGETQGEAEAKGDEGSESKSDEGKTEEDRIKDTPVGKRTTDTANPDEIPTEPDDGLIDIENTN